MKYLSLSVLLLMSACSSSPSSKSYVCLSALTPLGGIQVDTSNTDVTETKDSLEFKARDNLTIVIPKALCVEVRGSLQ